MCKANSLVKISMFNFIFLTLGGILVNATFEQECLEVHNKFRRQHGVRALRLSEKLQKHAENRALKMAEDNKILMNVGPYGENIFMSNNKSSNAADAVQVFYNGIKEYNFERPSRLHAKNSFSQLVWKNSERLGCGLALSKDKIFVVANYDPRGNIFKQFKDNVFAFGSVQQNEKLFPLHELLPGEELLPSERDWQEDNEESNKNNSSYWNSFDYDQVPFYEDTLPREIPPFAKPIPFSRSASVWSKFNIPCVFGIFLFHLK